MTTMERRDEMVRMFTVEHWTHRQIGERLGVSHVYVGQELRRVGVTREQGTWVKRVCEHCGGEVRKRRSQVRGRQWSFCRPECYYAFLEGRGQYQPWRQGCRKARAVIAKYVAIPEDAVVHHWDGDNGNNAVWNLAVFANQAEHMRHHRGGTVRPVWDGRTDAIADAG